MYTLNNRKAFNHVCLFNLMAKGFPIVRRNDIVLETPRSAFPTPDQIAGRFFPVQGPEAAEAYVEATRAREVARYGISGNLALAQVATKALDTKPNLRGVSMSSTTEEIIYDGRRIDSRRKIKFGAEILFW